MKSSEANRIVRKISKITAFIDSSIDSEGNLTKGQVNKVVRELDKMIESLSEVNVKSKKRLGNAKGKQVMVHQTAVELQERLNKILKDFEVLAANTKKRKIQNNVSL